MKLDIQVLVWNRRNHVAWLNHALLFSLKAVHNIKNDKKEKHRFAYIQKDHILSHKCMTTLTWTAHFLFFFTFQAETKQCPTTTYKFQVKQQVNT